MYPPFVFILSITKELPTFEGKIFHHETILQPTAKNQYKCTFFKQPLF